MRRFSVDNLLLIIPILGAIAAGLWEGGQIQATMVQSVQAEHDLRQADVTRIETQISGLATNINDMHNDVRELRSYLMVKRAYK